MRSANKRRDIKTRVRESLPESLVGAPDRFVEAELDVTPDVKPASRFHYDPISDLDLMIMNGWGDIPQVDLPDDWRTRESDIPVQGPDARIVAKLKRDAADLKIRLARELSGEECRCGAGKKPAQSFCFACYDRLPRDMARAMYRRIGSGYESAYRDAVDYLKGIRRIR
jgi:hypothetical protein